MAVVTKSMPCRLCGGPTFVQETNGEPDAVRRQRWCKSEACGHRFVTIEVFERDVLATPARSKAAGAALGRRRCTS